MKSVLGLLGPLRGGLKLLRTSAAARLSGVGRVFDPFTSLLPSGCDRTCHCLCGTHIVAGLCRPPCSASGIGPAGPPGSRGRCSRLRCLLRFCRILRAHQVSGYFFGSLKRVPPIRGEGRGLGYQENRTVFLCGVPAGAPGISLDRHPRRGLGRARLARGILACMYDTVCRTRCVALAAKVAEDRQCPSGLPSGGIGLMFGLLERFSRPAYGGNLTVRRSLPGVSTAK